MKVVEAGRCLVAVVVVRGWAAVIVAGSATAATDITLITAVHIVSER